MWHEVFQLPMISITHEKHKGTVPIKVLTYVWLHGLKVLEPHQ